MNETTETRLLKRIEEYVIDEGNIASFKWVSRSMDIHVNLAKQLLRTFMITRGKSYENEISATYLLSGVKEDGSICTSIVADCDVEKSKMSLVNVFSEHIYSVQRCKALDNYHTLYTVDMFEHTSDWKASPIACEQCVPRSESEMPALNVALPDKKGNKVTKTDNVPSVSKVPEQKNLVKNPFSKADPIKATESKKDAMPKAEQVKIEKPAAQKKANPISSMFSAQQKRPATEKKLAKLEKGDSSSSQNSQRMKQEDDKMTENTKEAVEDDVVVSKVKEADKRKKTEGAIKPQKKRSQKKSKTQPAEEPKDKKRKRIRVLSDSDDSDKDELDDAPSPEPEPEPPEEVKQSDKEESQRQEDDVSEPTHRRKKRKIVEKQEMDDQGYIVISKEVVFETDSEPEAEQPKPVVRTESAAEASSDRKTPESSKKLTAAAKKSSSPKKPSPKKTGKGKPSSDGRKQASLLSFFKKS